MVDQKVLVFGSAVLVREWIAAVLPHDYVVHTPDEISGKLCSNKAKDQPKASE